MLQNIRNKLQGTVAKVIIALITVPFAVFGIDAFFNASVPEAAWVNGEAISESELAQGVELQRRRLLDQSRDNPDPALLDASRLRGPVLDALIDRKLVQQVAEEAGFRVSETMLNQIILEDTNFQDDGKFSQARFQGILASNGMTASYYRRLLSEEILMAQVMNGLTTSEFVTERELREVARITQQSMDVHYLTIPVAGSDAGIVVPEEQVRQYYEENKADFRTEELVSVEYLELKLEDLFAPVAEQDLRREYDKRMASFKGGTERHAAHIMLSSLADEKAKEKLATLRERAVAGEDFAVLARENSEDIGSASSGGDLGFSAGDAFPEVFEQVLAGLAPGEVSEPLQTSSGWHLVKLLEVRVQKAPGYDEMRAAIERDLQRAAAEPQFVERSEKLADLTFNSDGLSEAAKELGLKLETSELFGRRGGEGLFADTRVIRTAFSKDVLDNAQNSELIELDSEHAVVLHLKQHRAEAQQELADVHDRIADLLRESLLREKVRAQADEVLASMKAGKDAESLAKDKGYQWQVALQYRRGSSEMATEIGEAAFATPRADTGAGYGSVVLPDGDAVVFKISNFKEGDSGQIPEEQQQVLRSLLQQARGREISAHYQKQLRQVASIERL
ncbi:MAG: SurA N-terminal domain-containing protein [Pseudomonadales bacterium]|nr:SurA N-terminal domain-containing protein [Pseudomonadales bacterium]